ncbi:MAG: imidazole glycerol phosphate synthase subunit HisH [bacterium]|nr:MAG: imidazole glycerol phosphate synthase subunit HisH [bacterium]
MQPTVSIMQGQKLMIAIIDYDMGNLRSVQKGFEHVGAEAGITRDPEAIASASALVLPGVGAFGVCMEKLQRYGLIDPIRAFIESGKPFLGICLGLQLLFEESVEFGSQEGLGILKGRVMRFGRNGLKVPHMGWNGISIKKTSRLLEGINDGSYFYFVHSFYVVPDEDVTLCETDYDVNFVSAVEKGNIFATQFHPEKSQRAGLKILGNFTRVAAAGKKGLRGPQAKRK